MHLPCNVVRQNLNRKFCNFALFLSKTRALRHHYVLPEHMLFILHCTLYRQCSEWTCFNTRCQLVDGTGELTNIAYACHTGR